MTLTGERLERVRAVSIALDREHEASISALRGLAESSSLAAPDLERFRSWAEQSRRGEQSWSAVILLDPTGKQLVHVPTPPGIALPDLRDNVAFQRAVSTREPTISSLVTSAGSRRYATFIALPVMRAGELQYVLLAEIDQKPWLHFLSLYPVVPGATMTLLDQNRVIIARTLNDEQSVGRPPAAGLNAKSMEASLAAYGTMGLEGQWFYSAHSRAALSSWTVATGVRGASRR